MTSTSDDCTQTTSELSTPYSFVRIEATVRWMENLTPPMLPHPKKRFASQHLDGFQQLTKVALCRHLHNVRVPRAVGSSTGPGRVWVHALLGRQGPVQHVRFLTNRTRRLFREIQGYDYHVAGRGMGTIAANMANGSAVLDMERTPVETPRQTICLFPFHRVRALSYTPNSRPLPHIDPNGPQFSPTPSSPCGTG